MIRTFLSRYHFRYPRSLAYMLQASEYDPNEYIDWYRRVTDFARVEKRKQFVRTKKALLLYYIACVGLIFLYAFAIGTLFCADFPWNWIVFFIIVLAAPFIIGYGMVIPLLVIRALVQVPTEYFIKKQTHTRLKEHPAVKIGIAGSYGKTSMREILRTVLAEGKSVAAPPGSYNTVLGISKFARTLSGQEEVLIFELGEYYPGDVRELCELVLPEVGVITGVNQAHLDKFKTLEATTKTIFELADWLGEKRLYVNGENSLASQYASASHILYTREGLKEMKVIDPVTDLSGTKFELEIQGARIPFSSKLLGFHQLGPLVAAIDIALQLGIPLEKIQTGISKTKPFEHRLEPKTDSGGVTILDDAYNGNPDGAKAVIDFLARLKGRQRIYVTPGLVGMSTETASVHREIGKQLAAAEIEKVILIRNSVTDFIAEGLKEGNFAGELLWYDDALAAFAALPYLTVSGDVVLLQNDLPDQYH